jgi:hypothetical protein
MYYIFPIGEVYRRRKNLGRFKMKLKKLGDNQTEIEKTVTLNGGRATVAVLYSYQTPVAFVATWPDGGSIARKTSRYYSRTTSRHINAWMPFDHLTVDQSEIDAMAAL